MTLLAIGQVECFLATFFLVILVILLVAFCANNTPKSGKVSYRAREFQRMANEYTKNGAFVDCYGRIQTDADLLIDLYQTIKDQLPVEKMSVEEICQK